MTPLFMVLLALVLQEGSFMAHLGRHTRFIGYPEASKPNYLSCLLCKECLRVDLLKFVRRDGTKGAIH